ncbi:MAG: NifB/NifX family molybdenum-iron cluster-binding protein [Thermoproteota archaeon]|jgi:predicted Fe-Mo cluster-binding NifX family protein
MRKLRVAFGMGSNSLLSDEHFGDSEFYFIYDVYEDHHYEFIERRENTAKNVEEKRHGDPRKFIAVVQMLRDVDVLAAFRMGPNYVQIKNNSDKVPFITGTKKLEEALAKVSENFNKLWEERSNKVKQKS